MNLPDPHSPGFLQQIRTSVDALADPDVELKAVLSDVTRPKADRFAALYGLLYRLRREERYREYIELFKLEEGEFGGEPLYDTFRIVATRWLAEDARTLREAIPPAKRAVKNFPDEAGVLHQYADLLVSLAEIERKTSRKELHTAEVYLNRAISKSVDINANHFSTRARLRIMTGDFRGARGDIAIARSAEDPSARDFARRMSRYEALGAMIEIHRAQDEFMRRQRKAFEELEAMRKEQLQLLGLFAAIIALIVAGITLSTKVNPTDAIRLILVSAGASAIVFVALSTLLARAGWIRAGIGLIIGASMICTAVWLVPS